MSIRSLNDEPNSWLDLNCNSIDVAANVHIGGNLSVTGSSPSGPSGPSGPTGPIGPSGPSGAAILQGPFANIPDILTTPAGTLYIATSGATGNIGADVGVYIADSNSNVAWMAFKMV